jgi:metal-responsive CopG/Arc/MetJ family transcriptional regulator
MPGGLRQNAGRKPIYSDRTSFTVSSETKLKKELDLRVSQLGYVSRTEAVNEAIEEWLQKKVIGANG